MTITQYHDAWALDAPLKQDDLDNASMTVPVLHAKWWRFYTAERHLFRKLTAAHHLLKRQRHEWFSGKLLDDERLALGWEPNPKLIRLPADLTRHMDADDLMNESLLKLGVQEDILKFIESVIASVNKRGYDIKNAIDFLRFKMGQ